MGEEDVEGRENAARCFFSDKTPPHPCGVLLVRFLPTWAENEHKDKHKFIKQKAAMRLFVGFKTYYS